MLTIDRVKDKVEAQRQTSHDFIVSNKEISMDSRGRIALGDSPTMSATSTFHKQAAARVGIPFSYYRKLYKNPENRDLLADNFNRMNSVRDEQRLVRTLDGKARAYLSDRYLRLDNDALIKSIDGKLKGMEGAEISMSDDFMTLKMVSPKEHEVTLGDPVRMGYMVSNSETGLGTLKVSMFIERLVCENGMVGQDNLMNFSQVHLGSRNSPIDAIWASVNQSIDAVMDNRTVETMLNQMRASAGILVGFEDGFSQINEMGKSYGLSESEIEDTKGNFVSWGDESAWGLSNAITRTATTMKNRDRATDLQNIGGVYMRDILSRFNDFEQIERPGVMAQATRNISNEIDNIIMSPDF